MSREEPKGLEPEAAEGDGPFPAGLGRDEPPGEDTDRLCVQPALEPRSSRYFASLDATVKGMQERVQHLISRINGNREEDHKVLSSFKDSLLLKVSGLAEQLEERLFHLYDFNNELIQERLQALEEVMERVEEAQAELRHVCCTMEAAYRDLCLQPEA